MLKKFIIVLSALLIVLAAWIYKNSNLSVSSAVGSSQQINDELTRLEQQRTNLNEQITQLEEQLGFRQSQVAGGSAGSAYWCITDADSRLYSEVFPVLAKREFPGVIVMRDGQLIGDDSFLTAPQIQELTDQGWSLAVSPESSFRFQNVETDPPAFQSYMSDYLASLGRSIDAVYFADGQYDPALDEAILALGFEVVFYEGNMPIAPENGLKRIGILHYRDIGNLSASLPKQTVNEIGLTVVMNWNDTTAEAAKYDALYFDKIADAIAAARDSGIVDFPPLKVNEEDREAMVHELNALYARLDEIEQALQQTYQKFTN